MTSSSAVFLIIVMFLSSYTAPLHKADTTTKSPASYGGVPTTHTWQAGSYEVKFAAGPLDVHDDDGHKSHSTFAVTRFREGQAPITKVATSAINMGAFEALTFTIPDVVKVFLSPSERYLLISEDVPNETGPCSNFLLFEVVGDELRSSYLKIPRWLPPLGSHEVRPPIENDLPTILRLTDDQIEFNYAGKHSQSLRISAIPKASRESYP